MVRYFGTMTTGNWIELKRQNAVFKRTLKREKVKAWKEWAGSLSPRTPIKEIYRKLRMLNNYRIPNQPNLMFQNPEMTKRYMSELCKTNGNITTVVTRSENSEDPFTMNELEAVLSSKKDSAPGKDGIKYGDISKFPEKVKEKFLVVINEVWSHQNIPEVLKKILLVILPKPGRDLKLLKSHRPIALLSVYLKVINSLIKVRLEKWIGENGVLNGNAYGFVKHRSAMFKSFDFGDKREMEERLEGDEHVSGYRGRF